MVLLHTHVTPTQEAKKHLVLASICTHEQVCPHMHTFPHLHKNPYNDQVKKKSTSPYNLQFSTLTENSEAFISLTLAFLMLTVEYNKNEKRTQCVFENRLLNTTSSQKISMSLFWKAESSRIKQVTVILHLRQGKCLSKIKQLFSIKLAPTTLLIARLYKGS